MYSFLLLSLLLSPTLLFVFPFPRLQTSSIQDRLSERSAFLCVLSFFSSGFASPVSFPFIFSFSAGFFLNKMVLGRHVCSVQRHMRAFYVVVCRCYVTAAQVWLCVRVCMPASSELQVPWRTNVDNRSAGAVHIFLSSRIWFLGAAALLFLSSSVGDRRERHALFRSPS